MKKLQLSWLLIFVFAAQAVFAQNQQQREFRFDRPDRENVTQRFANTERQTVARDSRERPQRVAPQTEMRRTSSSWDWTEITSFPFTTTLVFDASTPIGPEYPSFFFSFTLTEPTFLGGHTDNNNAFFFFYEYSGDIFDDGRGGFAGFFEPGTHYLVIDNDGAGFFTTELTIRQIDDITPILYTELDYTTIAIGQTVTNNVLTPNVLYEEYCYYHNGNQYCYEEMFSYGTGYRFPVTAGGFYRITYDISVSENFEFVFVFMNDPLTGDLFGEDMVNYHVRWDWTTEISGSHIFVANTTGYLNLLMGFWTENLGATFDYTFTIEEFAMEREPFHVAEMTFPFNEFLYFHPDFNSSERESPRHDDIDEIFKTFRVVVEEDALIYFVWGSNQMYDGDVRLFVYRDSAMTQSTNFFNNADRGIRDDRRFFITAGTYYFVLSDNGFFERQGSENHLARTVRLEKTVPLPMTFPFDETITMTAENTIYNWGEHYKLYAFTLAQTARLSFEASSSIPWFSIRTTTGQWVTSGSGTFTYQLSAGTYLFYIHDEGYIREHDKLEFHLSINKVPVLAYNDLDYTPIAIGQTVQSDFTPLIFFNGEFMPAVGFRFPVENGKFYRLNYDIFGSENFEVVFAFLNDPLTGDFLGEDMINYHDRWDWTTRITGDYVFEANADGYINLLVVFWVEDLPANFFYTFTIEEVDGQMPDPQPQPIVFEPITLPYLNEQFDFTPQAGAVEIVSIWGDPELIRAITFTLEYATTLYFYGGNQTLQWGPNMYISQTAFGADLQGIDDRFLNPGGLMPIHFEAGTWYIAFGDDGLFHFDGIFYTMVLSIDFVDTIPDVEDPIEPILPLLVSATANLTEIELPFDATSADVLIALFALEITAVFDDESTLPLSNNPFAWTFNEGRTQATFAPIGGFNIADNFETAVVNIFYLAPLTINNLATASEPTTSGDIRVGTEVTLVAGTRTGNVFASWYVVSGDVVITNNAFTMPANAVEITANWDTITPVITFNPNSGTLVDGSLEQTIAYGGTVVLPTVARETYIFEGWFTAQTGGTAITAETIFTANATVYAQWTAHYEMLTLNDGGIGATETGNIRVGAEVTLVAGTRENYNFTGWTVVAGGVEITNNTFTMPANAVTITANWEFDEATNIRPTETENPLVVWVSNGTVHISGLQIGERFEIFTAAGIRVYAGIATCNTVETLHATSLPNGIYILRTQSHAVRFVK